MRRLGSGARLLVATHNAGKLEEMRQILGPRGLSVEGAAAHGLPEPAETEETFLGNARLKALAAARATGLPALADDSGIAVEALGGAPGVRTADWAEGPGGRDFLRAMTRTHEALLAARAPEPWRARFVCVLVLAWPDGSEAAFEGICEGRVVWPPRGRMGHGYDPVFVPEGETRTFAEMDPAEKNALSHRGRALRAFAAACLP
ncbi:RdgB/HAM1 family non-canonical purine NTP pyrophosphatase [Rubellimicrobium sp. CFH 75288]|uniref:RdgB/HAM1 family non-canonical purine NTP pyrophosphatase n=1 Tax=Rubellimicrobium sp. CFH 75288 TaxID=2697034 RepID=UPI0014131208|nr:RdgB/HAM1 family non-canonical purine NTP pyrophosphatase [Rubellimicrobium sp. CFH 75288]NAZ37763.1 RdgB/HAM1 family non-canonical purine NTP pyrophosphatase [Rubellimicrobium sp. CFH 75288]